MTPIGTGPGGPNLAVGHLFAFLNHASISIQLYNTSV